MKSLIILLGITLCASRSISEGNFDGGFRNPGGRGSDLVSECRQLCGESGRDCVELPFTCGGCLYGFVEKDGECLPLELDYIQRLREQASRGVGSHKQQQRSPDADIDTLAAASHKSHSRQSHDESADLNSLKNTLVSQQGSKSNKYEDTGQRDVKSNDVPAQHEDRRDTTDNITTTTVEPAPTPQGQAGGPSGGAQGADGDSEIGGALFVAVVAGCSVAGLVGLVVAGVCWYKLQKNVKAASDVDYPAYGVTGPAKEKVGSPGDRKLAQSAQMYHYQHQKQQMIAMEKANNDMTKDGSEVDTDEENEEGDYTVFECPGLAPTGEMEVKNPLFNEETPVTPSGGDPSTNQ